MKILEFIIIYTPIKSIKLYKKNMEKILHLPSSKEKLAKWLRKK